MCPEQPFIVRYLSQKPGCLRQESPTITNVSVIMGTSSLGPQLANSYIPKLEVRKKQPSAAHSPWRLEEIARSRETDTEAFRRVLTRKHCLCCLLFQ